MRKYRIMRALVPCLLIVCVALVVGMRAPVQGQGQAAPKYKFDPDWPKPLPNKWKLGGVTGLAVDKDDNVWVLNRPNDLTSIELEAELNGSGRVVLRYSGTESLARIMIEGEEQGRIEKVAAELAQMIRSAIGR